VALVGARNAEQAVQNARAIEVKLAAEEIDFITKELAQVQLS
jgi:aryl-alcohol dehydrogenase-like predicted oxidoreductase